MTDISVVLGDSLIELRKIATNSVDLIIADPPYNLGKDYGATKDNLDFNEYLNFSLSWLQESHRILKDTGTIYVFMGVRFISYIYKILEKDLGMNLNNWICWHYTQGIGRTKGFSPRHDDILMFSKTLQAKFNLDAIRIPQKYYRQRNNMRGANPGDVWLFSHVHYCNENRQNHPTQKPEGLIERMVLASSDEDDLVLDPFCGSGTTLRVCQQLKRRSIGIEINDNYVKQTIQRLKKEFKGFDSIDPRMARVPMDLNDKKIREEYLLNHEKWFLTHHENAVTNFRKEVKRLYNHENYKREDTPMVQEEMLLK